MLNDWSGLPGKYSKQLKRHLVLAQLTFNKSPPRTIRHPDAGNRFVRYSRVLLENNGAIEEHHGGRAKVELAVNQDFAIAEALKHGSKCIKVRFSGVVEFDRNVDEREALARDDELFVMHRVGYGGWREVNDRLKA